MNGPIRLKGCVRAQTLRASRGSSSSSWAIASSCSRLGNGTARGRARWDGPAVLEEEVPGWLGMGNGRASTSMGSCSVPPASSSVTSLSSAGRSSSDSRLMAASTS